MPAGTDPLFSTTGLFSVIGQTGTDSTVTWATPQVEAMNGADGDVGADGRSTYLASIFQRSSSTITATPTGGSYNFGSQVLTPPSGGWEIAIPTGNTFPLYISTALASAIGASATDSTLTWTAPTLMAMNGEDGADGSDGTNGTNGSDGSDGTDATQTAEGSVYFTVSQSSNPGPPSASDYDFTDGSFTGLTSNWQVNPVTVTIENTSDTFWMSRWRAVQAPGASTATITFQTPIGSLVLGTDIQSDNFMEGVDGWRIERDTGNAEFGAATIRGTLTAGQIDIDGTSVVNSNGRLRVSPTYIRDATLEGRRLGDIMITGTTGVFVGTDTQDPDRDIIIDSIDLSGSTSSATLTINPNANVDIVILGDIMSLSGSGVSSSPQHTIVTQGNVRIYGNIELSSGQDITIIASQGCVQEFGERILSNNSRVNLTTSGGNICRT